MNYPMREFNLPTMISTTTATSAPVSASYLKRDIVKCLKSSYEDSSVKAKIAEITSFKYAKTDNFYENLVYSGALESIDPVIHFVTTKEDNDIWEYFRVFTSSISTKGNIGRRVRFFVKDKQTNKFMGIACIGEDPYAVKARDQVIGWTKVDEGKLKHIVNITCCVPIQPFGFNYNGGKLIAGACYSKEVIDHFEQKYGTKIAMINTFSINGKSIMYDRLPYLKFAGYTTGTIPSYMPDQILDKGMKLLADNQISAPTRGGRVYKLRAICKFLGMDIRNIVHSGKPRGVYVGFTGQNAAEYIRGECDEDSFSHTLQDFQTIFSWWKSRWAMQRYAHLTSTEMVKPPEPLFFNPKKDKEREVTRASTEAKILKMGPEEYHKYKADYMKEYRQKQKLAHELVSVSDEPVDLNLDYLAGFFDGDGSMGYYDKTVKVEIGQCDLNIVKVISEKYGMSFRTTENGENGRPLYKIELTGRFVRTFLNDIKDRLVLKSTHAKGLLDILHAQDTLNKDALTNLKTLLKTPWKNTEKFYDKLNWEYVGGLFDAEGCILMNSKNQLTISITQASDRTILEHICNFCEMFRIEKSGVRVVEYSMSNIRMFLQRVLSVLHVKKHQAMLAIEATTSPRPNDKRLYEINVMVAADKHKLFKVPKMMTEIELRKLRELQNPVVLTPEKMARDKAIADKARERMMGENNPNYGVERSEEHCRGIAKGVRAAKLASRKITDAEIDAILAARAEGTTLKVIAARFGYSLRYMSDVCAGKVLKSADQLDLDLTKVRRRTKPAASAEELKMRKG